ncbi:Piso0_005736 [Millerozyma farinosa CBS 7064]|uniref:Piso0_005736 protein n=1 Tax=Pichia sorbitophila (strain ATCC MYA-4447 / BCRC 22081 / CBS 7064 / NBRC 10061 / NRRL Y-12695) TaxID=559304 RepID=G8XZT4_PICSO|nr:Piso0_005736 [Millerozyma farinosa CBS 7064]
MRQLALLHLFFVFLLNISNGGVLANEFTPSIKVHRLFNTTADYAYFDDSRTILSSRNKKLYISNNDGVDWNIVKEAENEDIFTIVIDDMHKDRAIAFGDGNTHFITNNGGKDWKSFRFDLNVEDESSELRSFSGLVQHATNRNLAMIKFEKCSTSKSHGPQCKKYHFYTEDNFKSDPKLLDIEDGSCIFAKSSKEFEGGEEKTIYCSLNRRNSLGHVIGSTFIESTNFLQSKKMIKIDIAPSSKILDIYVKSSFLIIIYQNDKYNENSRVTLVVSKDGKIFNKADLKVDIAFGVMAFLDASPSSIFVEVIDYSNPFAFYSRSAIFSSDSQGLSFTKILDNVKDNIITKVQTIDGVWIANVIDEEKTAEGKAHRSGLFNGMNNRGVSMMSFDNGGTWQRLEISDDKNCKVQDGCSLHVIGLKEQTGEGKFVTGPTPGILLAIGVKGKGIEYSDSLHTWISRDGGLTWQLALDEPCAYSFGDQGNIIVAVPYTHSEKSKSTKVYYSIDQGKSWSHFELEVPIYPITLTTTVDGTSTKFILSGLDAENSSIEKRLFSEALYAINFENAFGGVKCDLKKDFEEFYARKTPEDKPVCVYGHKERFLRRKQDAKCFVNRLFENVKIYDEPCECTVKDFECAPGYVKNNEECVPNGKSILKICDKNKKDKVTLPDKKLIGGNSCKNSNSVANKIIKTNTFDCNELKHEPGAHGADIAVSNFEVASPISQFTYIESGRTYIGENILVKSKDGSIYASNNGGISFVKVAVPEKVVDIYTGFQPGQAILVTNTEMFYYSSDGGNMFIRQAAPVPINSLGAKGLIFHRSDPARFIWLGNGNCDANKFCTLMAYITLDEGRTFRKLKADVTTCDFVSPVFKNERPEDEIFCTEFDKTSNTLKLTSSENYFDNQKVLFDDIIGYAITGHFLFVATLDENKKSLKAKITEDGSVFADSKFPANFKIEVEEAYTILDSDTGSIFMHITTSSEHGLEVGAVLKSNSNGTSYVLSLDNVNRNSAGYVDFNRVDGLEGVILSNTVDFVGKEKKLKTQITHNDGAEWAYIPPPKYDSKGKRYSCDVNKLGECSLNLHGFTEKLTYEDSFSSPTAIGFLMGVGNVGKYLDDAEKASLFLSKDGGISWREVMKGNYVWQYADRGTIIVVVKRGEPTKKFYFSLDDGETFIEYEFSDKPIRVLDLSSVPSEVSRKLLIFGEGDSKSEIYSIDFSNVYERQCQLDLDNPDGDDFEYWSPKHPLLPDNCLFGHESKYLRRAEGHYDCFIGSAPLIDGFKVTKNCSCTRRDYECDYNYFRDKDGTCKLIRGLTPIDYKEATCKKKNEIEYFEPSGYRKIPLSTCHAGLELDSWDPKPCPGKLKQFKKKHSIKMSTFTKISLIYLPILVFVLVIWFVYDRGIRRNGGFKRFGQIRLDVDEDDFHPIEDNNLDKVVNKIVKGGVIVAASVFAGIKAVSKFDRGILDKLSGKIFGRSPGRRRYVRVPGIDEEEELFGDLDEDAIENFDDMDTFPGEDTNNNQVDDQEVDERLFNLDDESSDGNHTDSRTPDS